MIGRIRSLRPWISCGRRRIRHQRRGPRRRKQSVGSDAILARFAVELWIQVDIALEPAEKFRQITRGRSSANTMYHKIVHWVPRITCSRDEKAISKSEVMDGIFPLATNTDL